MAAISLPHNTDPSPGFDTVLQFPAQEPSTEGLRLRTKNGVTFREVPNATAVMRRLMHLQSSALHRQCDRIDQLASVTQDAIAELKAIGFTSTAAEIERRLTDALDL